MSIGKTNVTAALERAEQLLQQDKSASPQMRAMFDLLILIINLLLSKLGLNSTNSSIPPSQDPHRQTRLETQRAGQKRKPGGQHGHEGVTLQREPDPDQIEPIAVDRRTIPHGRYTPAGLSPGRSSISRSTST